MNVRRLISGVIIATIATAASSAMADEKMTQPYLGEAEPIGSLLMEIPTVEARMLSTGQAAALVRRLGNHTAIGGAFTGGSLIVTASLIERTPPEAAPHLGPAVPLASLVEAPSIGSVTAIKSSGMIYLHLQQTVHLLDAIGLHDQSLTVEGILMEVESQLDTLESTHRDRVALAIKRAELAKLQAEITELSSRIASDADELLVLPVNFDVPSPDSLQE